MDKRAPITPAFGKADLSNCEREQIHLAGSIQPHGALLAVRETDYLILQASVNASSMLSFDAAPGQYLNRIRGNLIERIKFEFAGSSRSTPVAMRCCLDEPQAEFDVLVHRVHDGVLIVEFERTGPKTNLYSNIEAAISKIISAPAVDLLCDEAAAHIRDLTGYDRVMLYRFDAEGHGQVVAERHKQGLESYLGNWYPASDIPQIARRLYERNRVRMLTDVSYTPVRISPKNFPPTGADLDMSLCFLRSMSPIHLEYLKNMGVSATLVASLMVGGNLWGLIACHHYTPKHTHYELRTACEVLAEVISTRIASLESFARARVEMSVRRLEDMMLDSVSRHGDWKQDLFANPRTLLEAVDASGVALVFEGRLVTAGDLPRTQDLRALAAWLEQKLSREAPVFATASLGSENPEFAPWAGAASGVLAARIPDSDAMLLWFKPERRQTLTWGGDPMKPFIMGNNSSDLSPRRSFAQWHQVVEGTSAPWTQASLATARMIAESIADVTLQFRALRLLVVQDQLEKIRRQVRFSEQFAAIADEHGRILMTSKPFHTPDIVHAPFKELTGLAALFSDAEDVRERFVELAKTKIPWRGEASLHAGSGQSKPVLVRAEPVFSGPGTLLGYIVLLTDISAQRTADTVRRQSLKSIVDAQDLVSGRLDAPAQLDYVTLLSLIVGNAQRATMEITDGIDTESVPRMIQSVKSSVARTAELLENLVAHDRDASKNSRS